MPFTIFKPCMFKSARADPNGLVVGHDDTITSEASVTEVVPLTHPFGSAVFSRYRCYRVRVRVRVRLGLR